MDDLTEDEVELLRRAVDDYFFDVEAFLYSFEVLWESKLKLEDRALNIRMRVEWEELQEGGTPDERFHASVYGGCIPHPSEAQQVYLVASRFADHVRARRDSIANNFEPKKAYLSYVYEEPQTLDRLIDAVEGGLAPARGSEVFLCVKDLTEEEVDLLIHLLEQRYDDPEQGTYSFDVAWEEGVLRGGLGRRAIEVRDGWQYFRTFIGRTFNEPHLPGGDILQRLEVNETASKFADQIRATRVQKDSDSEPEDWLESPRDEESCRSLSCNSEQGGQQSASEDFTTPAIEDVPEMLPPGTESRLVLDPPNMFRFDGRDEINLAPQHWKILSYMKDHPCSEIQVFVDAIWGDTASDISDSAISSAISKLNTRLAEATIPISLAQKSGYMVLSIDG